MTSDQDKQRRQENRNKQLRMIEKAVIAERKSRQRGRSVPAEENQVHLVRGFNMELRAQRRRLTLFFTYISQNTDDENIRRLRQRLSQVLIKREPIYGFLRDGCFGIALNPGLGTLVGLSVLTFSYFGLDASVLEQIAKLIHH